MREKLIELINEANKAKAEAMSQKAPNARHLALVATKLEEALLWLGAGQQGLQ